MTVCYLCGSASHVWRGNARDNAELAVLECTSCSLVFLSSSTSHIHPSHYAQSAMHGDHPPPIDAWLRDAAVDDERRFRWLEPRLVGKKLLDFGCGAGGFLLKARMLAADVSGVEPESRLHPHFTASRLRVFPGIDDVAQASIGSFDLVTAFHVVEHLPDPRAMLIALAGLLKSDGELIVEVPNSEDALLKLYACDAFGKFTYWSQHLYLFNRRTLSELVRQAGLRLRWLRQVQRYPLSNHLHWLSRGKPGGHQQWAFIDSPGLGAAYEAQLASLGQCDTLLAGIGRAAD